MKRSFIIPTLLILLLPVQIINADVQSQNSVLHQHSIEIERCINNNIRKADSLVKAGKPDEALTYYKSSLNFFVWQRQKRFSYLRTSQILHKKNLLDSSRFLTFQKSHPN